MKLKGTFNDKDLNDLSSKLNVTVNLHNPNEKQQAMGWLQKYQSDVDKAFNDSVTKNGKGFNITINDLPNEYKGFLDPVTYVDTNTKEAINQNKLNKTISDLANKDLNDGLGVLPQNLNVDTTNVINKSTLDSYSIWIKNYQTFINDNKKVWFDQVTDIASRGFATKEQENQIKSRVSKFLNNDNIKNYLKNVIWEDNKLLKATSNDYKQFILLDKLQADTIAWVNKTIPKINIEYHYALTQAESNVNMHDYKLSDLLGNNQLPQTKEQINNYKDGLSFHNWLQSQANNMFKDYQLKMGLGIGIPLAIFTVGISIFLYWRFSKKNQPYSENLNKD